MPEVARSYALAGVADYHVRADNVREPEAGVQDLALKGVGVRVHEVDLERGVDSVRKIRLQHQVPERS
ncbi:MAG TPA: hypothetical protein VFI90_09060 [Rubrobacter sp.]|nr:hypothetical protein [Rubrobacter sp.]